MAKARVCSMPAVFRATPRLSGSKAGPTLAWAATLEELIEETRGMTDWVVAAEELRAELLAPDANDVDSSGVIPASHFDALRNGGFYGLAFKSQDPIRTLADTGESTS